MKYHFLNYGSRLIMHMKSDCFTGVLFIKHNLGSHIYAAANDVVLLLCANNPHIPVTSRTASL